MALEDYEQLRDTCASKDHPGDQFSSSRAYASARKFGSLKRRTNTDGVSLYHGKMERGAFTVSIEDVKLVRGECRWLGNDPPPGLRGEVVAYSCVKRPTWRKFRRAGVHNAQHGLLETNVTCRLIRPFGFVLTRQDAGAS